MIVWSLNFIISKTYNFKYNLKICLPCDATNIFDKSNEKTGKL